MVHTWQPAPLVLIKPWKNAEGQETRAWIVGVPTEEGQQPEIAVFVTRGALQAYEAWLIQNKARFEGNRCALLTLTGEVPPECRPPSSP